MLSIKISQIPSYLHASELFHSLNHDDPDDCILVPDDCFKPDTLVHGSAELHHTLLTIRYWGIEKLPHSVIEFLLINADEALPVIALFEEDLRLSEVVEALKASSGDTAHSKLLIATRFGQLDILEYCMLQPGVDRMEAFALAAQYGNLHCMRALVKTSVSVPAAVLDKACKNSCSAGESECLKYLLELGAKPRKSLPQAAIRNGHVDCLAVLCNRGIKLCLDDVLLASQAGRVNCLEYALKNCEERSALICENAAIAGSIDCLKLAVAMGCAVYTGALAGAARHKHLDCMQYALQHGASMSVQVSEAACQGGHMPCVQFVLEQQCPLSERCMVTAARNGSLPIIKLLSQHGVQPTTTVCIAAAKRGHLRCLWYLHSVLGCALDQQVLNAAAAAGQLPCLRYIHSKAGAELQSVATTAAAAGGGSLKCLRFLRDKGCPWDHTSAVQAAQYGRKDILTYICDSDRAIANAALKVADLSARMGLIVALLDHTSRQLEQVQAKIARDQEALLAAIDVGFTTNVPRRNRKYR